MSDQATTGKTTVQCGSCESKFRVGDNFAGKLIRCPKCKSPIRVPEPASSDGPEPQQVKLVAPKASGYDAGAVFDSDAELLSMSSDAVDTPKVDPPPAKKSNQAGKEKKGTTRRLGRDKAGKNGDTGRPMMNRAPTVACDDEFSRQTVQSDSRPDDFKSSPPAGGGTGVRSRTATMRRDNNRGTTRRVQPPAKNNTPMIVGAIAGGVALLLILVVLMGGGSNTPRTDGVADGDTDSDAGDSGRDGDSGRGDDSADRLQRLKRSFDSDWESSSGDVNRRLQIVEHWFKQLETNPGLRVTWAERFESALHAGKDAIRNGATSDSVQAESLVAIGDWAKRCKDENAAEAAWKEAIALDPNNNKARIGLGYMQYRMPEGDEYEEMAFLGLLDELQQFATEEWYSPERYAEIKAFEERIVGAARAQMNSFQSDPFQKMAHEAVQSLQTNTLFDRFDFETFVARPFVVLLTRDKGGASRATDAKKRQLDALLRGIWANWLKVRAEWQLSSTRNDTLENPEPFVWIAFHEKSAYDAYQAEVKRELPPGARAFYNNKTRLVYFYDEPGRDTSDIVIHETFHQLMDRFSQIPPTHYQNHCFTEGAPEYYAGYRGHGESLVLGELTRTERINEIRAIHSFFDAKKRICYPPAQAQIQVTPDDWIFYDAAMLMTLRDMNWVRGISRGLAQIFAQSVYMRRRYCQNFVRRGEAAFHSSFYAFAWAFTHWLNKTYPNEYRRFAQTVMNSDRGGDAETFLEAFNIRPARPLPDIKRLVGPNNRDLVRNQSQAIACLDARIAILRQTPAIQEMHRRWAEWMRTTFTKVPNAPQDDLSFEGVPGTLPGPGAPLRWHTDEAWLRDERRPA